MIDSNVDLVTNLEQKIDLLVKRYEGAREDIRKLRDENLKLTGQLEVASNELADVKGRYDSLKLAKTLEVTQVDAHEAKLKINQLVREIDKCIALLNR